METLKMHSLDGVQRNIELIGKLFPNAITEVKRNGKVEHAIDFDVLRQELSDSIVEGREERYQFTWPDKKKAMLAANAPITATLRPVVTDSVGKDGTPGGFDSENLYIEGDNLEVLKLLQETYLGKVKMIYIDPPYNTGNDFVYNDDFSVECGEWRVKSGDYDESGNRMVTNTESNGRFHTDWLNMIYPRLRISKDLLADDGIIFISIGEDEVDNLHKIANEIFGEQNEITIFSRVMKSGGAKGQFYTPNIDYVLVYAKNISNAEFFRSDFSDEQIDRFYNRTETSGKRTGEKYGIERLYKASLDARPNQRYYIECPDGEFVIPPGVHFPDCCVEGEKVIPSSEDHVWKWTYDRYKSEKEAGNIVFIKSDQTSLVTATNTQATWNIYNKLWLNEQKEKGIVPGNFIAGFENRQSAAEMKKLDIPFDYAKPVRLLIYLIKLCTKKKDCTILDFFSGSATTAHAVMQLNAEDGGHRKFIMVQLPEKTDEKSEAYKAGYKNICEIGKERIRRAGKQILSAGGQLSMDGVRLDTNSTLNTPNSTLDVGFRCLRLDSSNMENVYYTPKETRQQDLFSLVDNVKPDRTPEDLLFQVMLDLGVLLSSPIEVKEIAGKKVFNVADGFLLACFDHDVTEETVKAIAQMKPYYAVFRDSSMANDSVATNFDQIFETYSPETVRKVL
mgnify:CR=1 FL=1